MARLTPNNDNNNDDFEIKNIEQFKNAKVEIYNRWGDILFKFSGTCMEYKTPENRWDGTHNGKDLPMGSYVYIIQLDDLDPFTGVCSIIR
jgi:gliding motility-associated-like protein